MIRHLIAWAVIALVVAAIEIPAALAAKDGDFEAQVFIGFQVVELTFDVNLSKQE